MLKRMNQVICLAAVWVVMLLGSCLCHANENFILVEDDTSLDLVPLLSYRVSDKPLSIDEVARPENSVYFKKLERPLNVFKGWVWYRFSMRRGASAHDEVLLNFNQSLYSEILVFYQKSNAWQYYKGGLIHPFSERPVDSRQLVFPLWTGDGDTVDIYFRIHASGLALFDPSLQVRAAYQEDVTIDDNFTMLTIGFSLGILVYMASLAALVRDKVKIVTGILFLLSVIALVVYSNGYLLSYLDFSIELQRSLYLILLSVMTFFGGFFVWSLLVTDQRFFAYANYLKWFLFLFLSLPILSFLGFYDQVRVVQLMIDMVFPAFIFVFSAVAVYKRVISAQFYFLAISSYMAIQLITVLTIVGVLDYSFLTRHFFEFAALSLGLFISIALTHNAYRHRLQQEELERVARVAEARDQTKSEFLAAMSHEIRTPINGVLGMAQMLQRTSLDNTQRYYSDVIISAGKTLLNIINDVLDFSKIEAGKLELENTDFNLGEMIARVSLLFGSSRKNDQVDFELSSDAAIPLWLHGDSIRLQQILNNLLSNSFKFTEHGSVEFHVGLEEWLSLSRVRLKFMVKDSGIGIADELKDRLFMPYAQADKSTTRKFGGTGLGLSICRQLVNLLGGEIGVESKPGEGACFWFTVEFDVVEKKQNELLKARSELQGKSIALVLSQPKGQRLIAEHLREWGMEVDCIDQSVQPAELRCDNYDVMILGSSVDVSFKRWLDEAGLHQLPVLLMNPISETQFEGERFQKQNVKYLKMPASLTQLQYALLELLGMTDASSEGAQREDVAVTAAGLSELSILVAEDNMVNLKVIQALLKSQQVEADFVLDGKAAVEHYCSAPERYDVILMDCEMPNMDGFEATMQIRAFEEQLQTRRVSICALTAHAMEDITRRCLDAGMDDVLIKPIDLNVLLQRLQAYVHSPAGEES